MREALVVALVGNPNSGKSTIFNNLSCSKQRVGNYPGVTVELKESLCRCGDREVRIVDLPGVYGLNPLSNEEFITRRFMVDERPDLIVNVLDASHLERNLYLSLQLMEMGLPMLMLLNMSDLARARGYDLDLAELSSRFGLPVLSSVGYRAEGMCELISAISSVLDSPSVEAQRVDYGPAIEAEISKIEPSVDRGPLKNSSFGSRFCAVKLLEGDAALRDGLDPGFLAKVDESRALLEEELGEDMGTAFASYRYRRIAQLCEGLLEPRLTLRQSLCDGADSLLLNRFFGLPVFFLSMYAVFYLVFNLGAYPMEWIEVAFMSISSLLCKVLPGGPNSLFNSLVVDGVLGGVSAVIVFMPNILLLFAVIALLEYSGYMARAAFLMDGLMRKVGLQGKSFLPMLIGFGCTIPAIMATRILESRRDRLLTMFVLPLMSCSARLPIFMLIIPSFFPSSWHAPVLWVFYLIGIAVALLLAKLLSLTALKGESAPLILELPPYSLPPLGEVLARVLRSAGLYLKKAGTLIFAVSVVFWAVTRFPTLPEGERARFEEERQSLRATLTLDSKELDGRLMSVDAREAQAALRFSALGRIGKVVEPLVEPMGFDWRVATALVGAFAAKELFVSQMAVIFSAHGAPSQTLRAKLRSHYTPLKGFCIMLFCLLGFPCMATVLICAREANYWTFAFLQLGALSAIAYALTASVYRLGLLFGL